MNWKLWVALGIVLLAVAVACLLVWRLTRPVKQRAWRWSLRAMAPVLGLIVASVSIQPAWATVESGTWICVVCGEEREETRVLGVTVSTGEPKTPGRDAELAARYRDWYQRSVAADHRHTWRSIGCHGRGDAVILCAFFPPHLEAIPQMPDQARATAAVRELLETPHGKRLEASRGLGRSLSR